MHSNKLVLFGLSPNHTAIQNHTKDPICEVKFNTERQENISGKRKAGALSTEHTTVVCEIVTRSGVVYKIRAFVNKCKLIEVNEKLTGELLV